jgi:TonB family protein
MEQQVDNGPNLLPDWRGQISAPRWGAAGIGSLAVHVVVFLFLTFMIELPPPAPPPEKEIERITHRVTPLYAPRFQLTQKDPNKGKPTQELSVQNLASQQASKRAVFTPPAPPVRKFQARTQRPDLPPIKPAEPPQVQTKSTAPQLTPQIGAVNVPPPKPPPQEPPKLAFETPGQGGQAPIVGGVKIAPPKTAVDDAVKNIARGAGQGNITLSEMEPAPGMPDSLQAPQVNGASKILPELLSDPQGVDFKPYIIRVLSLVRRNWMAIIPESAHLGRRGVVTLQFIVDRSGQVPKLVIASTSGVDALDRAAVAGVSASVPLPPLPPEFQGKEVRLQFSFKYNVQ